jgi:hypothetical protein
VGRSSDLLSNSRGHVTLYLESMTFRHFVASIRNHLKSCDILSQQSAPIRARQTVIAEDASGINYASCRTAYFCPAKPSKVKHLKTAYEFNHTRMRVHAFALPA